MSVTDPRAQRYESKAASGVIIIDIRPGTPADKAGFNVGDVIMKIGNQKTSDVQEYRDAISDLEPGKPVIFHVQRSERKLYIAVTP
jgi:serine protease Do